MQNGFGFKPGARQHLAGGGVVDATVHAVKHLFGIDQQPQQPPRPVQQPSVPVQQAPQQPQSQITDYAGGGALKRREAELGLKAGGFVPAARRAAPPVAARTPFMPQQMPAQQSMQPGADQYGFKHGGFVPKSKRQQADRQIPPGQVQGPGTGTSDSVHGQVPTGSYIMPADSTAQIGPANLAQIGKPRDVALSNGEYHLPPEQVYAAGVQALDAARNATHAPVPADQMPRGFKPGRNFLTGGSVLDQQKTPTQLMLGNGDSNAAGGSIGNPGTPPPTQAPAQLNLPDYTNPASTAPSQATVPGGDVSATPSQPPAAKKSWTTLSPDDPNNIGMQQIRDAQQRQKYTPDTIRMMKGGFDVAGDEWRQGNYLNSLGTAFSTAAGSVPLGTIEVAKAAAEPVWNFARGALGFHDQPAPSSTPAAPASPATTSNTQTTPPPQSEATAPTEQKKDTPDTKVQPTLMQRQNEFDQSMQGAGNGSATADASGVDPTDAAGLRANAGVQYLAQNKNAQQAFDNLQSARKNDITASTDANGHLALTNLGFNQKAGQQATQSGSGNTGPNIDLAGANARTQAALAMLGAQDANPAGPRGGSISNPDASNGLSSMMRPVRLPNGSYAYTSAQTQAAAQQQSQAGSNAAQIQAQAMRDAAQANQTATTEAGADRRFAATNAISQSDLALRQQTQANQMAAAKPLLDAQQKYLNAQTPEEQTRAGQLLAGLQRGETNWHSPIVQPPKYDPMTGKMTSPGVYGVMTESGAKFFDNPQAQQSPYPDGYQLTGKDGKVYVVKDGQPVLTK